MEKKGAAQPPTSSTFLSFRWQGGSNGIYICFGRHPALEILLDPGGDVAFLTLRL